MWNVSTEYAQRVNEFLSASSNELVRGFDSTSGDNCYSWIIGRPSLIIGSNYAVWRFNSIRGKKQGTRENLLNSGSGRKEYNGNISKATASKIKKMLTAWLGSVITFKDKQVSKSLYSKRLPTFVTLTLPPKVSISDNDAKRLLLSRFLDIVKQKYNVKHYFWRAEAQRNGSIHFHVIIDSYIWKQYLTLEWNRLVLIHTNATEFQTDKQILANPSTHVKGINDVNNFIEYVVKYAIKEEEHRIIKGRLWGCSDSLREVKHFEIDCTPKVESTVNVLAARLGWRIKKESGYILYFGKNVRKELLKIKQIKHEYSAYLKDCLLRLYDEDYQISTNCMNSIKRVAGEQYTQTVPVPTFEQLRFLFFDFNNVNYN